MRGIARTYSMSLRICSGNPQTIQFRYFLLMQQPPKSLYFDFHLLECMCLAFRVLATSCSSGPINLRLLMWWTRWYFAECPVKILAATLIQRMGGWYNPGQNQECLFLFQVKVYLHTPLIFFPDGVQKNEFVTSRAKYHWRGVLLISLIDTNSAQESGIVIGPPLG